MVTAYIGVGSNIAPYENIEKALIELKKSVKVSQCSTFYRTKPLDGKVQDDYINGVWEIKTDMKPDDIKFDILNVIEKKLGRKRTADKYSSRTIDLDLLLYDDIFLYSDIMRLPDKDIYTRPFLAFPLFELNNRLVMPDTKKTIKSIADKMDKSALIPEIELTLKLKKIL